MNRQRIDAELESLPIGKTRMIAWEAVTRWSADSFEIGTWGKKTASKADTLDTLDYLTASEKLLDRRRREFASDTAGAGLIEYALLAGFAAVASVAVFHAIGTTGSYFAAVMHALGAALKTVPY